MKNIFQNKHFYLCCLVIALMIAGCKKLDWYDQKVDSLQAVPTTLTDLQAMLDANDIVNAGSPVLGEWASDDVLANEANFVYLGNSPKNAFTWSHMYPYTSVNDWNSNGLTGAYVRIFYSNVVLDRLKNYVPKDEEETKRMQLIKGQAIFLKARTLFELMQIFSPPYTTNNASEMLGVPLRMESDINVPSVRLSITATYDFIVSEMTKAKMLLTDDKPSTPLLKCRATKAAVDGYLSRIYLSMERYDLAGAYADSCLMNYDTLLDYNLVDTISSTPFSQPNPEIIYHNYMAMDMGPAFVFVDTALYNQYTDGDLRKKIFFVPTPDIYFKGSYHQYGYVFFSGLATDELFLTRAESNARAGNVSLALDDLNTLLRKRWNAAIPYTDINITDPDQLLSYILMERRKELLLRGLRWTDLRRLNSDSRYSKTITHIYNGETYTLEPGSYQYTFPYPDDVVQMSGLQQNPGW